MRNRLLIPLALAAAIGAVAVAGCGDDDDETTTAAEALTEEEFVSQANEICAAGDEDIDQVANETFGGGQPSRAELEDFVGDTVVPSIQEQIDSISALSAPEEIADDVNTFLDDAETALAEVEADPVQIIGGDEGPFGDVNRQAEALGLTRCAG